MTSEKQCDERLHSADMDTCLKMTQGSEETGCRGNRRRHALQRCRFKTAYGKLGEAVMACQRQHNVFMQLICRRLVVAKGAVSVAPCRKSYRADGTIRHHAGSLNYDLQAARRARLAACNQLAEGYDKLVQTREDPLVQQ